ncbi:MAG: hypothetical protein ACLT0U_01730 [Coprococcus sp.]
MANDENLKPVRTKSEARERGRNGGKASGKSRRRKAALRDTMNRLLTMQVDVTGLSEVLLADGGESTYEEVIGMAMIEQAMAGNVKAYQAIMQTVGQTVKSDSDLENQQADTELKRAKKQAVTGENETDVDMELNINIDYGDEE